MDPIHIFQNGRHFQNGRQPIKKRRKYRGADRLLRSFTNQMKYYNTLLLIMLIIKHLCKKNIYFKYFVNFVLFVRSKGHFLRTESCFFGKYSFTLIINKSIKVAEFENGIFYLDFCIFYAIQSFGLTVCMQMCYL